MYEFITEIWVMILWNLYNKFICHILLLNSILWIQNIEFSSIFSIELISWIHVNEIRFVNYDWIHWNSDSMNSKAKFELVNNPAIKSVKTLEWQSVITLEWQGMSSAGGASDPALFDWNKHRRRRRVNVLDLDIRAVYARKVEFWSIQEIWEHQRVSNYVFRGWLKTQMHRLLTQSSNRNVRLEECRYFYDHLWALGKDSTFHNISWNQQSKLLEPKVTSKADNFFTSGLYNGCVFSSTNAGEVGAGRVSTCGIYWWSVYCTNSNIITWPGLTWVVLTGVDGTG